MISYYLESPREFELLVALRNRKYCSCKMTAEPEIRGVAHLIKVTQISGNCVDIIDGLLDEFGGYYHLELQKERDKRENPVGEERS